MAVAAVALSALAFPQAIEFESGGLKYQAVSKGGLTVMVAPLNTRILGYSIIHVTVSNGSVEKQSLIPEKFRFQPGTGRAIQALSARAVVSDVLNRAGRNDVGRLVGIYEAALFGNSNLELRHGYEARRKDAMAIGSTRMRAAAAAAAVVLGTHTLDSGESIDGALFLPARNRPLPAGKLTLEAAGETFEFTLAAETVPVR